MTYVGKILVVVIMAFALFFLALSTVVFTTEVNWKKQVTDLTAEKQKLSEQKQRLIADVGTQKTFVDQAKLELEKANQNFANQLKTLTEDNSRRQDEITKQRTAVETALEQVKAAQEEAQARISEATVLRDNLQKVQAQRDEFKLQKTDLDQRIIVLNRELDVAKGNNSNLRNRLANAVGALRKASITVDLDSAGDRTVPKYDVEGEVKRVAPDGKTVEITIGSNDGLSEGNQLTLFRTDPLPQYIGKITIISVDVNQAVGRVVGSTFHGVKIKEGDNVATQVRPRR